MSDTEGGDATAPGVTPAKLGFWQWLKTAILRTDKEIVFAKGLGIVTLLGTLIGGYFQYLSAYQGKVAELAEEGMKAATSAFAEASNALSVPLSLQERLTFSYNDAIDQKIDKDDDAYVTQRARAIDESYETAYTTLRENVNLLARNMEIYLDWASDIQHDAANPGAPTADPITTSLLGAHNFSCDKDDYMPFAHGKTTLTLTNPGRHLRDLTIDWNSAKHHVFTIVDCFEQTHKDIYAARQWASKNRVDDAQKSDFKNNFDSYLKDRMNRQVVRLNIFMGVAMNEIDGIRAKYRPNGFKCHVPILRETIDWLFNNTCAPVRTRQ